MNQWEKQEDRLLRYMKIPAQKKMQWLRKMQEFTLKASSKELLAIRWKLRRKKSLGGS